MMSHCLLTSRKPFLAEMLSVNNNPKLETSNVVNSQVFEHLPMEAGSGTRGWRPDRNSKVVPERECPPRGDRMRT